MFTANRASVKMATTVSFMEYPYIIWRIKGCPTIQQLRSNYFYHDSSRFFLSLEQESNINVEKDHYSIYLEEWGSWTDGMSNFVMTVYAKDKYGYSCFVQDTEVTESVLADRVRVWHVRRVDLISKYGDISTDDVITLFCTVGPHDVDCVKRQSSFERKHKSVQASLTVDERTLNMLSDDFLGSLEEGRETDIILSCEDGSQLSAHRAVLSARSEVFSAMFRSRMSEAESGVVQIEDVTRFTLFHFLKYLYSGRLDSLTEKSAESLYAVGDKYAVSGLKERCANFMVDNLNKRNVFDYIMLADRHSDVDFSDSIVAFISQNDGLLKSKSWLDFWQSEPDLAFKIYEAYVKKCSGQVAWDCECGLYEPREIS